MVETMMPGAATDMGATMPPPAGRAPFAYFLAVFALAWLCWSPAVLAARFGGRPLLPLPLLQALGSWAPVVAAATRTRLPSRDARQPARQPCGEMLRGSPMSIPWRVR